jgi:sterol desaturase/sphingolipid hydroxylase (fatty acid hydroxylase superfamily)
MHPAFLAHAPGATVAPDLTRPLAFAASAATFFAIIFLRYVFMSGMYHHIVYRWFGGKRTHRVMHEVPGRAQMIKEIGWSALTSLIFAVSAVVMLILWERGLTRVYLDPLEQPLWWLPVGLLTYMFIHETYYYWLHRWMHIPAVYKKIHKVHHDSVKTSSFTSFSFHPVESLLQAIVIPILVFVIPINVFVLLTLLILMTVSAIINHSAVEVYPRNFQRNFFGRWLIGSAHHDLHHKKFRCNYGLYFTFWDKWMKTESPEFEARFDEKTLPARGS